MKKKRVGRLEKERQGAMRPEGGNDDVIFKSHASASAGSHLVRRRKRKREKGKKKRFIFPKCAS